MPLRSCSYLLSSLRLLWWSFCLQWSTEIKVTDGPAVHKAGKPIPFLVFILLKISAGFNTPLITPWLPETLFHLASIKNYYTLLYPTLLRHSRYKADFMGCSFCVSFAGSPSPTRLVNVRPAPRHSPWPSCLLTILTLRIMLSMALSPSISWWLPNTSPTQACLSHQLLAQISNCIRDFHHLGPYKPKLLIFPLSYYPYNLLHFINGNFTLPVIQVFQRNEVMLDSFFLLTLLIFKLSANSISCTVKIFFKFYFKDLQKMKERVEA